LWSGFLRIFSDAATVLSPLVLQQLTAFVANRAGYPSWYGYVMAFVLFVMQLLITFFMNASFDLGMKVGFSVRSILISSVYRKTLLLSQASRSEHSAGKITSLMSTDATRVDMAIAMLHFIWSAPITIIVAMALLIINLGASALVGLALLLVVFPLQGYLMKYLMGVRMKATKITDQRVKITQEAIQGVRVIKYQGWEEAIIERIEGLRTDELKYVRIMLNARAYLSAIMQVQPVFAAILTFVVFGAVGGTLTPQIVFPSLALFNVIRLPLMFLPMVLTQAADASISLSRIQAVLLAPELQERTTVDTSYRTEPYYPPSTSSTGNVSELILDGDNWAIRIRDASFEWEAPPKTEEKQVKPKSSFVARFSSTFKKKDMGPPASKTGFGMSTMAGAKDTVTKKNVQGAMMDGTVRNMPVPIVPDVEATSPVVPKVQLRNVTFIAPRGSLTCVVGPVGSGKSWYSRFPIKRNCLIQYNLFRFFAFGHGR
jgi:ABC-type multidrug transport system fused ATPase/permease subunit